MASALREQFKNENFYPDEDYEARRDDVKLWRGFSTAPDVLAQTPKELHLVYIDGDHTHQGTLSDINHFAPRPASP